MRMCVHVCTHPCSAMNSLWPLATLQEISGHLAHPPPTFPFHLSCKSATHPLPFSTSNCHEFSGMLLCPPSLKTPLPSVQNPFGQPATVKPFSCSMDCLANKSAPYPCRVCAFAFESSTRNQHCIHIRLKNIDFCQILDPGSINKMHFWSVDLLYSLSISPANRRPMWQTQTLPACLSSPPVASWPELESVCLSVGFCHQKQCK